MPEEHALLSASGAKKWLNCPLSLAMESEYPETESNEYAAEGTAAHALAEAKLRFFKKEYTRSKYHKAIKELPITEDMEDYTDGYRDYVIERLNASSGSELLIEQRLDFSEWVPQGFGTGDAVIVSPGKIEIIDLKYGRGISVSAENNPQLRLYALGALELDYLYDFDEVTVTIYQPRVDNISSETFSVQELREWGEKYVAPRAQAAFERQGKCVPGCHCDEGFCRARAACRAYADMRSEAAKYEFKKPSLLTDEEIADLLDEAKKLASWAKLVADFALEQAVNNGVRYPGWKLVEGRSNRTYSDEERIRKILMDSGFDEADIYKKSLNNITTMEKLLGKKAFNDLIGEFIVKPEGAPTLVHNEDKRPELNTAEAANADFSILKNESED